MIVGQRLPYVGIPESYITYKAFNCMKFTLENIAMVFLSLSVRRPLKSFALRTELRVDLR